MTPAASGLGTHQQLGLPPCPLHLFTGYPCPGCGLTTSVSHLLDGHWSAAIAAHPLGPLALFMLLMLLGLGSYGCLRPFSWTQLVSRPWCLRGLWIGSGLFMATWICK